MKYVTFLLTFPLTFSYNFLVFCPLFGHSHTTFFAKIADTLSDAGHNVTFFTPTVTRKYEKINYVRSTKNVIHLEPSEKLALIGDKFQMSDPSKFWKQDSSIYEILPMIDTFFEMFVELTKVLEENLELLDKLKEENFDVMIFENIVPPAYSVLDYLQIETFIPSTSIAFDNSLLYSIGEPFMPSAIPFPISEFSDRMSFSERLINSISIPIMNTFLPKREFKSFRPPYSFIEMASLEPLSSFIFTNSNSYIDYPRPTLEKNVQIGGISVEMAKLRNMKVDEEWDRILNMRSKTVLISFGSFMLSKDMPLEYKYRLASETLALQFANQPVKPKELLVRHAEFAARFGRLPSLDPYSRHMSFIEYFLIDIAFVGSISLFLISFVLFLITKQTFSFIRFMLSSAAKLKSD
ncbi:hypothetical protein GCK72_013116 [Caenorhabditis remanei]|uniref:glucuronosyltransferase n=1 Tax=Caenorhabditis remanei TaxID=31234 RepID=A0A6A5GQK3_CAERE|nr:hypothetical protein GCK72_013116 [Caenorhabditis remanei]KAF1756662.1 hypothetical protein GCK72_013116 [Caenorhabditis remanei]